MNISALLAQDGHLLITTRTRGMLQQLTDLARQSGDHICAVTPGSPLLAELTVAENIALPGMYHLNLPLAKVLASLGDALGSLGLDDKLDARPANLSRRDALRVQLLRCAVLGSSIVLLQAPRPEDARQALRAMDALSRPMRLWVACLERHAPQFAALGLRPMTPTET